MARVTTPRNSPLRPRYLVREHGRPAADETAVQQFDQNRHRGAVGFEGAEERRSEMLISGTGQRSDELISLPSASNTLMPATSEMAADLGLQAVVHFTGRHQRLKAAGDAICANCGWVDNLSLDGDEIVQMLVEMTRQQQHGIVELAFGALQRALAEYRRPSSRCRPRCRRPARRRRRSASGSDCREPAP